MCPNTTGQSAWSAKRPTGLPLQEGKVKQLKNPQRLREALAMLDPQVLPAGEHNGGTQYAKGLLVGAVSALMAMGFTWEDAVNAASEQSPITVALARIPEGWLMQFNEGRKE